MTMQIQLREAVDKVLVAAVIGLLVSVGIGDYFLLTEGHAAFNTTSDGVSWGLPIVTYDYFLMASAGLAFVACLGLAFEVNAFLPVVKRCLWLALGTLVGGVSALFLELGHPIRSLYAIPLNFQFTSPLFWKTLFISAYALLLLVLIVQANRPGWSVRASRVTAALAFVALLGVTLVGGAVTGMMAMRPTWFGGEVPVLFLFESIVAGFAFTTFVIGLTHGFNLAAMSEATRSLTSGTLPKSFAFAFAVVTAMVVARMVTYLWSNADGLEAVKVTVGSVWFQLGFWAGLVLPLVILLSPGLRAQPRLIGLAAVLVLLGLFIGHYEYLVNGQIVPLFKGSWVLGLIDYTPSVTEWMLALLALSMTFAIYAVGEKMFNLDGSPATGG